jgi:hypothetical protein
MKNYLTAAAGLIGGVALMLAATPAAARVNVDVHIGVPGVVYAQPAPVYVQPRPVHVHTRPVYVERHDHQHWRERQSPHRRMQGRHDQDRDGIPNRFDRDRDGDGIRNRHDSRPHNPYRY